MFGYKLDERRDGIGRVGGRKLEDNRVSGITIPMGRTEPFLQGCQVTTRSLGTIGPRKIDGAPGLSVFSATQHTMLESKARLVRRQRQIPPGSSAATRRSIELDNRLRRLGINPRR